MIPRENRIPSYVFLASETQIHSKVGTYSSVDYDYDYDYDYSIDIKFMCINIYTGIRNRVYLN